MRDRWREKQMWAELRGIRNFIDALREALDLVPLYGDGAQARESKRQKRYANDNGSVRSVR